MNRLWKRIHDHALAALAVISLTAPVAQANCQKWDVKMLDFEQGNNIGVRLRLAQHGANLTGSAQQMHLSGKESVLQKLGMEGRDLVTENGSLDGVIKGNKLEIKTNWDNGTIGMYQLSIDEYGRLTGETYDFHRPSSRARIVGEGRVACKVK